MTKGGFTLISKACKGFTLIELLVVISIIGIILSLAFVSFQETKKSARDTQRKADLEDLRSALEVFKADCGHYKDGSLGSSLRGDGSSSAYTSNNTYLYTVPTDPGSATGRQYYYGRLTTTSYELCAALENTPASPASCGGDCGTTCNYKVQNP